MLPEARSAWCRRGFDLHHLFVESPMASFFANHGQHSNSSILYFDFSVFSVIGESAFHKANPMAGKDRILADFWHRAPAFALVTRLDNPSPICPRNSDGTASLTRVIADSARL
jgi:hypothetical protein